MQEELLSGELARCAASARTRFAEMTAMREELCNILERWDERLAATRDGEPARLLEQLTTTT